MGLWVKFIRQRQVWVTGLVALAHTALLSWVLSQSVGKSASPVQETLDIAFAEVLPLPEPEPEPEPEPVIQKAPLGAPRSNPSVASAPSSKTVLTQLESDTSSIAAPQTSDPAPPNETAPTVDPSALAAVLQRAECQRLSFKAKEDCPKADPFAAAVASMGQQAAAPASAQLAGDYGPKSMLEGFFSQRDKVPYLMPGMGGDLFTSGLAPGAYDAQRIRNGQAPLWSKEMRDGFSKED
jgi:hypothetical protein